MHKTRLHEIIWFPFRPEQKFVGPLLLLLLLAAGATGIIKGVDIFTSFISNNTVNSGPYALILVFALCLIVSINSARSDYISTRTALLPCMTTTIAIATIALIIAIPKTTLKSALVQAGIGTFVSLGLVGRFVQSGGADLGKVGAIYRRTTQQMTSLSRTPLIADSFASQRAALVKDVQALAAAIQDAASEVVRREAAEATAKRLLDFVARSKLVDHGDFVQDLREGSHSLAKTLEMIGGGE